MKRQRLARNVLSNWTGLFLTMAISFFMSPFLVHTLGDEAFGLWILILSVTGYMGLLDIGLRVSVVKYVAKLHAVSDFVGLNRTINTALAIYGVIGVAILGFTLILEMFFSRVFSVSAQNETTARLVLLLAGANVAVTLVLSVFNGTLAGLQRYDAMQAAGISLLLARSAAIVVLIKSGYGIVALGAIHLCGQILNGLVAWRYALKECPTLQIGRSHVAYASAKELYSYSGYIMVNNLGRFLLFGSGEILIGMFLGAASITYYAIAGSVAQYMQQIVVTMVMVLHPYSSALDARGETDGLKKAATLGTKLSMLVGVPVTATFIVFGHTFLSLWMGPSYAAVAAPLLVILILARLIHLSQQGSYEVLLGMSRHRLPTVLNLVTGIASVAAGAIGVSQFGLRGMVIGGALPIVVSHGLIQPWYANRMLQIGWPAYLREAIVTPILAAVPYTIVLMIATRVHQPKNLFELGLMVGLTLPLFAITAFFLCFTAAERRGLINAVVPRSLMVAVGGRLP